VSPAEPPALGAFLSAFQHSAVLESYLQLMAEDKLRRDAQVQTLAHSVQSLTQQLEAQTKELQQAKDACEHQQALLTAYRNATEDTKVSDGVLDALFNQAFQAERGTDALVLYREIADLPLPDVSDAAHQLRALSAFNIGVVLVNMTGDAPAAQRAYRDFLARYTADSDPLVQKLRQAALQYLA
jgi:hypothetical protein